MATATVTNAQAEIARSCAKNALKWQSLRDVVMTMGSVKIEKVEMPEGLEIERKTWVWLITLEALNHGMMALRDRYDDGITFEKIPDAFLVKK